MHVHVCTGSVHFKVDSATCDRWKLTYVVMHQGCDVRQAACVNSCQDNSVATCKRLFPELLLGHTMQYSWVMQGMLDAHRMMRECNCAGSSVEQNVHADVSKQAFPGTLGQMKACYNAW